MKTSYGCVLIVALGLAAPNAGAAQEADTVYVGTRHSPTAAGLLELVVPTAGFAYGGDWTRGFVPNAFRIGALIGFGATADDAGGDVCEDDGWCNAFSVAVVATTIWAIVGAVQTAHDHNERVRETVSSSLLVAPAPTGGVSIGMRWTP